MANQNVRFYFGSQAKYDALIERDSLALYFIEDTQRLYKGDILLATGADATAMASGLMTAEDKMKLDSLVAGQNLKPVDGSIVITGSENGAKLIGVGISAVKGNLAKVLDDGIFVAVDKVEISQINGLENRLTAIEESTVGGIHYRGNVATKDELPANAQQGDLYECIDTGAEYCWNGTEWFEYGTSHFVPVAGTGIEVNGSTISTKLSAIEGNALIVANDNGLFVPECDFTDKDRVILDTMPMMYVTNNAMNDAISRAIASNCMVWEELDSEVGVAKIGGTYYSTIQKAIAAANDGDTVKIMAGTYSCIEFTDRTKANITLVGEDDVCIGKVRLVDTANYGAPDGLTLKNITFNGEGITASNDIINNMSIVGCTFVDGAVVHIGDCVTDGLIVENCKFEATNSTVNPSEKTAILLQGTSKNVIIRGNNIKDVEHNAIQVVGASGSMLIDSNTIDSTGSRAMRITTKDGAVLAIMNNVITNVNTNSAEAAENNGEVIKITGAVVDGAFANNTCDGNQLVFDNGFAKVV